MVNLAPEQQEAFVSAEPAVFVPVKGGWGQKGATNVRLRPAKARSVRVALAAAWRNVAPRSLAEGRADGNRPRPRLGLNTGPHGGPTRPSLRGAWSSSRRH